MLWKRDRLFCEISPVCYEIALQKEILKRHIKNFFEKEKFAETIQREKLPNVVAAHSSNLIKRGKGIWKNGKHNKKKETVLGLAVAKRRKLD